MSGLSRTRSLALGVRPLGAQLNPPAAPQRGQKMAPITPGRDPDLNPDPNPGELDFLFSRASASGVCKVRVGYVD